MVVQAVSLVPLTGAVLSALLIFLTLKKGGRARVHRAFILLNISTFIWSFFYFIEINLRWSLYNPDNPYLSPLYFLSIVVYTGISTIPSHWFLFAAAYSRRMDWFRGFRKYLAYAPTILAMSLMPTNAFHHLWYSYWAPDPYLVYGPMFYVYSVIAYLMVLYAMVLYLRFAWELKEKIYKKQAIVMLLGSTVVIAGNVAWVSRYVTGMDLPVDPTPLLFAIGNTVFAYALFRMGFLEIVPIAIREVFHNMEDGAFVLDDRENIVEANPSAYRILPGIEPGKPLKELYPGLSERLRERGERREFAMRIGRRYYWMRVMPLETQGESAGTLVIITDITEIKRKEAAIRRKNRELEKTYRELEMAENRLVQAGKLAALGNLVSGMEPEIRRETQAIRDSLAVLEGIADKEKLEIIERSVEHIQKMVERLHIFTENRDVEMAFTDINALLRETIDALKPEFPKAVFEMKFGDMPELYVAPGPMKRVFEEIIRNAAEALGGKGKIGIETAWNEEKQEMEISISDSGEGISEEYADRVFDPFFTTKGEGRAGLGLTFALQIVHDHGGRIDIDSELGAGSTVKIHLPSHGRFVVEDVFLIHRETGLLIEHVGTNEDTDEDILSSMFTVVMSFIKDSFSGKEDASLSMMELGERRISIEQGKHTYLVVMFRGSIGAAMPRRIKRIHNEIEEKYGKALDGWDGRKESLSGISESLSSLMEL